MQIEWQIEEENMQLMDIKIHRYISGEYVDF